MKTLKELEHNHCNEQECCLNYTSELLREVAIEWIKVLIKKQKELTIELLSNTLTNTTRRILDDSYHQTEGKIEWIKLFFGINEEDLK